MMTHLIPNTFGIEAHCPQLIDYASEDELLDALPRLAGQRVLHIGAGSNLLFLHDFEGTVLHNSIHTLDVVEEKADEVEVRVGGGYMWDDFVALAVARGWHGAENLSLIPGEVGASAVQNIGAYGAEAKDLITQVECIDLTTGEKRTFENADCHYAYRQSVFKTPEVRGRYAVLYVRYRLSKRFNPRLDYGGLRRILDEKARLEGLTPEGLRQTIIEIREAKLPDPKRLGNAGSFFMNPVVSRAKYEALARDYADMPHYVIDADHIKIPAGWMIEQCGWKGRSLGPAAVHDRQALILVNCGGATGADILRLSDAVRADVKAKFGIDIHPEVNFID